MQPDLVQSVLTTKSINKKICNKLLSLCQKGTASTYVTKAANFNGWEAAEYLLERYEGFSKQHQRSLRQLVENLRHIHVTNMSKHVDKFERICSQMAHNNPTKPPTEEQKIDWFLDSVTEKTYDSVHSICTDKLLEGDLTFAKVLKLYTLQCFQRYPHFQVEDIDKDDKKTISNNSTTFRRPRDKGTKGKCRSTIGRGRGGSRNPRHSTFSDPPRSRDNRPKGKGNPDRPHNKGKGKDNSSSRHPGNRQPKLDPCSYCGGASHNARNCFKRIADEKSKPTAMKQANQNIIIDEATMEFSQFVLFTHLSDFLPSTHTARWGEQDTNWTTDSDTITEEEGTNADNEDTLDHTENKEDNTLETLNESKLTSNNYDSSDTDNDQTPPVREKEEQPTQEDTHTEQHPSTPLPIIEPLP
jgi:hypothetical protein